MPLDDPTGTRDSMTNHSTLNESKDDPAHDDPASQLAAATIAGVDRSWFRWSVIALGLTSLVSILLYYVVLHKPCLSFHPPDGVTLFAGFYVVAQAIERLSELGFSWIGWTKVAPKPERSHQTPVRVDKATALRERNEAAAKLFSQIRGSVRYAAASPSGSPDFRSGDAAATELSARQDTVDRVRANRTLAVGAGATCLGFLTSGSLGLLLLHAVGASTAPAWIDILVTGLVLGGGSKAVHDLISNLQKSKEAKEDAAVPAGMGTA